MLIHVLSEAVLCLGALIAGAGSEGSAPRVIPGELVPAAVVDLDDGGLIALGNEWVIEGGLPSAIRRSGADEPGVVMALSIPATEDAVSRREIGRGEELQVVAAERGSEHSIVMLLLTLGRPFSLFSGEPLNYVNADYVVASVDIERQYVDWVVPIEDREVRIVSMCRTPDEFILVGRRYEKKADGGRPTVPIALRVQDDGQAIEVLGKPKLRGEALYASTTVHDGHVLASGLVRHGKEIVPFIARYSGLYEEPEVVLCNGADVAHITGMSATDSGVLLYGYANDKKLLDAGGVDLTMAEPDGDARFGFVIRVFMGQFDPNSTILLGGGFLDTVAAATERDGEVNILMLTFQSSSSEWNLSGRHRHVPTIYNLRVEDGRLIGSSRLWFSNPNLHTIGLPILARGGSVALGIGCLDSKDSEYTLLLASDLGMN